jgi:cadmium resistance protein CadD (predicted permease)
MRWLLTAITTGTLAFAATNIDDIFILTLFFAQAGKRGVHRWRVVAG